MEKDIDLLYEIGTLRFVERTWKQFLGPDFANNAEHSFRVAWIALTIAKQEQGVNTEKLLKIALLHDLLETRTGDVNYLSRQYTIRNDELAVQDIFTGTSFEEMISLFNEYKDKASLEAKIVKDVDKLDVDFELSEQTSKGNNVQEWVELRNQVSEKLYTESAKRIWNEIKKTSPHRWHLNSRNRFNAGDWKK